MYYHECPYCHAALDPGETCDCQDEAEKERAMLDAMIVTEDGGQEKFKLKEEVCA